MHSVRSPSSDDILMISDDSGVMILGPDVIQKLTRIETQVEGLAKGYPEMRKMIDEMRTDITRALDSTYSAHHRIDEFKRDVCWTIGASMTACGIFSSLLTWALGR